MTVAALPLAPPGQAELWSSAPGARPSSWRVVWAGGTGPAVRDLPVAAGRAAGVARLVGLAWLVGADGTWCAVTYQGHVAPSTGWAAAAARIIARSTPTS